MLICEADVASFPGRIANCKARIIGTIAIGAALYAAAGLAILMIGIIPRAIIGRIAGRVVTKMALANVVAGFSAVEGGTISGIFTLKSAKVLLGVGVCDAAKIVKIISYIAIEIIQARLGNGSFIGPERAIQIAVFIALCSWISHFVALAACGAGYTVFGLYIYFIGAGSVSGDIG